MVGAKYVFTFAPTFLNIKKVRGSPTKLPMESPKASEKPNTTQITLTTPIAMILCKTVEITFFCPTIPP